MLRGEYVICGTSSTGTGALTLAATPTGGIDFDVWVRVMGFGNSAVVPVTYTMIEYTSSVFSTAKQIEKVVGAVTFGTSSGIANASWRARGRPHRQQGCRLEGSRIVDNVRFARRVPQRRG